ncbi:MAG: hypothetical protein FJ128_11600 [Deltaproteobacteria bacterium]|nr:hypothetical protein [Deltaproteobacteria bacterium]
MATLAQAQSPEDLGKAIFDGYVEALVKVNELMKDKPDPKDLTPKVEALKEETIQKMVELGKKVAALDDAGRKKVDSKLVLAMGTVPGDVFKAFSEGQMHYQKADANLGRLIKDFNIITQYAFFDLLKKQTPKEAERLGIK